ncbi:3-phosphoinositide-dependent protein kinase 1 [Tolypocladium capitatum]|uniref:3-phosphoinositide-dependent protein kinase 1 n=1 Tax=Tolypocladium capitatum TaxID=45235 RepID=A0A2K3QJ94_9HYPO|nr:3-phosphoinositide-dependent protein kinase 1 [Tolypocladium capitatum]
MCLSQDPGDGKRNQIGLTQPSESQLKCLMAQYTMLRKGDGSVRGAWCILNCFRQVTSSSTLSRIIVAKERGGKPRSFYKRLNNTSHVPKLVNWDPDLCCLTLEHLENGSLEAYVRKLTEVTTSNRVVNHVPAEVRPRWAVQALRALTVVHATEAIHCNITPRNFLGSPHCRLRRSRYQPPGWNWKRKAMEDDDVFALGSVSTSLVGIEPYADLEVHGLFQTDGTSSAAEEQWMPGMA